MATIFSLSVRGMTITRFYVADVGYHQAAPGVQAEGHPESAVSEISRHGLKIRSGVTPVRVRIPPALQSTIWDSCQLVAHAGLSGSRGTGGSFLLPREVLRIRKDRVPEKYYGLWRKVLRTSKRHSSSELA